MTLDELREQIQAEAETAAGLWVERGDPVKLGESNAYQKIARLLSGAREQELERYFPIENPVDDFEIETWFERDRAHVALQDSEGETVIEWWDEDVAQAVEDGFLDPKDWLGSAIEYAEHLGLIDGD